MVYPSHAFDPFYGVCIDCGASAANVTSGVSPVECEWPPRGCEDPDPYDRRVKLIPFTRLTAVDFVRLYHGDLPDWLRTA